MTWWRPGGPVSRFTLLEPSRGYTFRRDDVSKARRRWREGPPQLDQRNYSSGVVCCRLGHAHTLSSPTHLHRQHSESRPHDSRSIRRHLQHVTDGAVICPARHRNQGHPSQRIAVAEPISMVKSIGLARGAPRIGRVAYGASLWPVRNRRRSRHQRLSCRLFKALSAGSCGNELSRVIRDNPFSRGATMTPSRKRQHVES